MNKFRILIVDDIYANRLLLSVQIRTAGHEFVLAENGKQALEVLKDDEIHLIFMDIEMPVMNGLETTACIRKLDPPLNRIPVVALTAHNPELFFEDYANAGFDELITKPYSAGKIRDLIQRILS